MSENEKGCGQRIALPYILHTVTISSLSVLVMLLVWERNDLRTRVQQLEIQQGQQEIERLKREKDAIESRIQQAVNSD